MRSSSTARADSILGPAWLLLAMLALAAPICALGWRARGSLGLLRELSGTVLPMYVVQTAAASAATVVLGLALSAGGLACALYEFPGRRVLGALHLVPMLLPAWFLAVMSRELWSVSGVWPLATVLGISTAPIFYLLGSAGLRNTAQSQVEVLTTLGRGSGLRLASALVPLALPSLGAAALVVFLIAWGDASCARVMAVPTLTTGVLDQWFGREDGRAGAGLGLAFSALGIAVGALAWLRLRRGSWQDSARHTRVWQGRSALRGWRASVPWLLSVPQLAAGVVVPWAVIGLWTAQRIERVDLSGPGERRDSKRGRVVGGCAPGSRDCCGVGARASGEGIGEERVGERRACRGAVRASCAGDRACHVRAAAGPTQRAGGRRGSTARRCPSWRRSGCTSRRCSW